MLSQLSYAPICLSFCHITLLLFLTFGRRTIDVRLGQVRHRASYCDKNPAHNYSLFCCHTLLHLSTLGQRIFIYASVGYFAAPSLTTKSRRMLFPLPLTLLFPPYLRSTYVSVCLSQVRRHASYCGKITSQYYIEFTLFGVPSKLDNATANKHTPGT